VNIPTLLEKLGAAGIRLRSSDGELRVAGNRAALDAELVGQLRAHKAALLELVGGDGEEWWSPPQPDVANGGAPEAGCIHALIEAQVERTPDAVAVVFDAKQLTYAELNARANQLAHHLRALGVGPDVRVAICVEHSPEMVVGVLAILKAGGAYVPLDPAYPADRLRYTLEDSAPAVLLTQASLAGLFTGIEVPRIDLDCGDAEWSDRPRTDPEHMGVRPDHLAYVIYTSGSTGLPKGVMVRHRGLAHYARWAAARYVDDRPLAFALYSSLAFDLTVTSLFVPLLTGGPIVVYADASGGDVPIRRVFAEGRVDVVKLTPAHLALLGESELRAGRIQRLIVGGEELKAPLARAVVEASGGRLELYNEYGPTETVVGCMVHRFDAERDRDAAVPIGRPISDTRIYLLDVAGEPVPVGVVGELHVGGVGVARGYLERPELTAERFVADPFCGEPGARMYRTGDLGRLLSDGTLEFLGRNDFQVKVRGFRIELGEIEARLSGQPGVRDAVVLAREDVPGDRRLVAYYVAAEPIEVEALRASLLTALPEYMVPSAYVRLEALPLTPNGKVDRGALPAPEGDAYGARAHEAPAGETETALSEIWAELLGVERVGRWDHFFGLGGHSLLAVQVISRVREVLGLEATLGEMFLRPVLAEFAKGLEEAARAELPAIEPVDRSERLALSFAQQRLWFLEQLGSAGAAYHIPTRLRLRGELDREAMGRALDRIVARHEALRTTFHAADGQPVQRIALVEESAFQLVDHDLVGDRPAVEAELRRLMAEESAAPFDLARGPLIRGRLVRLASDDHVLLVTMHHIVSDGWSMGVLTQELSTLYGAFRRGEADPLPPLPVQYADYAAWQRRWVDGEVLQRQADFWKQTLAGAPELLEVPADHARPARQDFAGAALALELDEALTAGLKALGRRNGTTLFMTLLAGWAAVLSRLSGQKDVVIGTPTANRGRSEIEGLIGFFVNTLALRVDLSGSPAVSQLLGQVKERALDAQHHQDIPFEQVVERVRPARSMAHSPLFQVLFAWQNASGGRLELPGLELAPVGRPDQVAAKFDLSLAFSEAGGRIVGGVEYATALFERPTVERYAGYLRRVLEAMAADEGRSVGDLPLLAEAERRQVVEEWNATAAEYPAEACVHELFQAQAGRTPDAVAVVHEGGRLTYAELNARSNRLAHRLRELGVGADVRVAVCVERGPERVVGVLGVLKAGGAFVPLDPAYPAERLRYMLEDSAPAVLLTRAPLSSRFEGAGVPVVELGPGAVEWAEHPPTDPLREGAGVTAGHPAYVIYTSGSTGRPKGVVVEHRGVCNLAVAQIRAFAVEPESRVLQFASFSFDACVSELVMTLCRGASLHLAPPGVLLAGETLSDVVAARGITHLTLPPAVLASLPETVDLGTVRVMILAGDVVTETAARRWAGGRRLLNAYGPTEATVCASIQELRAEDAGKPSIGRPISNSRLYVVDGRGQPVPVGVAGELYIGGAGVARGYLDRPGLTAERFLPDSFGGEAGARLYRTGDVGRWLANGTIEFLGRADAQVKVRGYRVEPGEIEARLAEHPAVLEAVVLARPDPRGDKRLVAYYAAAEPVEAEALRAHLLAGLPEHMVPAAYVRLEALPLTPNGKVDRGALPAPEGDAFSARAYEAPAGGTEEVLGEIWSELLGVERVGRWDHFFALGGHSLLAVQVISRVRQVLGVEVALGDLFVRPVLAELARALETASRAELPAIEPVERSERLLLSFAQQRLWFLEQLGSAGAAYHIPTRLRLRGELGRRALVRALDRIVARHEALRTTFHMVDGQPVQRIAPVEESAFHLVDHDLVDHPAAEAELRRLMAEEAGAGFDLARGPLIRGRLVRLAADDHVLLVTMHHIVSDGWSMGVLTSELGALYAAFRRGEPDPLLPLPVQYADYAAWQRRWDDGEVLKEQAGYWRETLSGAPELLELPTDHARPARQDFVGAALGVELDEELAAGLKALGRRHGATLFMTLLAGWATVLSRLSGQEDVVIGTPTANRGMREIEGLIGFFVNTLALRVDLSGSPAVSRLLGQVKARVLAAQHHQDIPFEQVVERVRPARSMAHTPLFQVMLAWQNTPGAGLELPGLELAPVGGSEQATAKFDLSLSLAEARGRIVGGVTYATSLFEPPTVERYLGYLRRVLEAMVAGEGQAVDRLPLLPEAERRQVVEEWNATAEPYPGDVCVHELFEAQAERAPDATAVVFDAEQLTYADLNSRANRLAHHLRALGVGPDVMVAICVEHHAEMIVGVLAILKAGGAYVPLDPAYPVERLRYVLADSVPVVLLTQTSLSRLFTEAGLPVIDVEADASSWADRPETNPDREHAGLATAHLAYVIYTSGSTGLPKGVMVRHRGLSHYARWAAARYVDDRPLAFALYSSLAFDLTVTSLFVPLLTGGSIVVYADAAGADVPIRRVFAEGRVDVVKLTPAHLALLGESELRAGRVQRLIVGGEELKAPLARAVVEASGGRLELYNEYGPTETVVGCMVHRFDADHDRDAAVPIGRPISNTRIYLLDTAVEPVPVGVVGELHVGGVGVARGYLERPELTAERFVADPFGEPGARMYRTGDLGRWRSDGTLEFLGRNDFQVKVRGFRIELGEIEARLAEQPGVRGAVVLAREDVPGDRRLVAYYAAAETVEVDALRAQLSASLPEYMVPSAYVRLEALPLTPNGKVDRGALPAPEGEAYGARAYEAPAGGVEAALAEIWAELLGIERVGRWDHFFGLGGHSLLAVQVISRVREVLGVEATLGEIFLRPVLAELARALETAGRAELPAIEPVDRSGRLALSFAQQRLWFVEQLGRVGTAYHIPTRLRLRGELDRAALGRALDRIVARHEALRTTFAQVDGEPVQRIAPVEESGFRLIAHDLGEHPEAEAELLRLMTDEAGEAFDLKGGPLIRGRLVRLAPEDHALLVTMHHIVSDGWSTGVLSQELSTLYAAFRRGDADPLPPLPVQYADYAAWQRRWVDGEVLREQADYWRETLAGAPELLELPTDHARPARQDFAGAALGVELDEELTAGLKALSRRQGTTLFMTLLAGWAAVLSRLSGQEDVVIGTPTANRGRREIEGLIGFFVNTLALRIDLSDSPSIAQLLGQVKERTLGAQHHQDIPFEQVVELVQPTRSMAHTPLFQVMFAWQNASAESLELPGLKLGSVGPVSQVTAKFDLSLSLSEAGGRIVGGVEYATSLFEQATVERYVGYLRRVLEAMVADESRSVTDLALLSEAERRQVVEEWNATGAAYPDESCIHALFEARVERTPDAVAVVHEDRALSYAELNARANRLARQLRVRGVGPHTRVAILLPRSIELVVAELAILKAGAAYVPIDPSFPVERIAFMVADSGSRVVLSRAGEAVPDLSAERIDVDAVSADGADNPRVALDSEAAAYVMYTSGSTGAPKGVVVPHRAIARLVINNGYADFGPGDRVAFAANPAFDATTMEIWGALLNGGRIVVVAQDVLLDPPAFARLLEERGVTALFVTTAVFNQYASSIPKALAGLRYLLTGGERADPASFARVLREGGAGSLIHCYGPTETTTYAITHQVTSIAEGARSVPLGRPISNTRIYLLDGAGNPVPVGVAGELYVGGAGVAHGYLNRPELTAERFVADPFSGEPGARLYRTGDVGRWLADGTIEFVGRNDFQVKVRGFRMEPGEIEARLVEHPTVREAVVLAREDAPGDRRLVAYYVGEGTVEVESLRAHLAERLPEYMVPAAYVRLDVLPLTPNGKLDRKALPAPEGHAYATRAYEAPSGRSRRRWRRSGRTCWAWSGWGATTTSSSSAGTPSSRCG
jgi:amino acid adenylation domain-containing protein